MEYQKIHVITEEMHKQLLDMIFSSDEDNKKLAEEIILNADTDDLLTCHYIEDICLTTVISKPNFPIARYYLNLRNEPTWKLIQSNYLAFRDEIFGLPDED